MFPKKSLKSLKEPKILRKMSFQIKVNNWGRCHNLGPWQVTWENFWGIRSSWGLFFHVISIFCLHHGLYKIHMQKLFAYGKMIAYGKIKNGRKSLIKKKKERIEKQTQGKEYHSVKKRKIPLWKWLVLAELHTGVQISNKEVAVKPKFAIQNIFKAGTLCKY